MKKIFLLTILLFQLTFVFGQEPQWSPWTSVSCYKGIQYSINNLGYNKSTNSYWWNIKWKNNYSKAVSFDGVVTIDGESVIRGGWGNIQPGGIQTYTSVPYKSNSINFSVSVSKVCFSDKYGGCSETLEGWANYAECDNGTPNYKINGKNTVNSNINSTNQTNTTNQQTTQQNDLSDYNRSKADLERQMNEKNAEITRQNEENARLGQIWNNAIKAGVDAHNKGNYTEAKNQFIIAINNSTNESNRQNAQNYYNKSVDAEKSQGNIKSVGDLAITTIKAIDEISKARKEEKKLKQEEKLLEEKTRKKNYDLMDDELFYAYIGNVIITLKEKGFFPDSLAYGSELMTEDYLRQINDGKLPNKRNIKLAYNGFELIINWDYFEDIGVKKEFYAVCKNKEIVELLKKSKVFEKWDTKQRKTTYSPMWGEKYMIIPNWDFYFDRNSNFNFVQLASEYNNFINKKSKK
jgi:hypothetical protein